MYPAVTSDAFWSIRHIGLSPASQKGPVPASGCLADVGRFRAEGDVFGDFIVGEHPSRTDIARGRAMKGISFNLILSAAATHVVSLPAELAGYLVLGVLDALGSRCSKVAADDIYLDEDGRVDLARIESGDRETSERSCRRLLRALLEVSVSPSPALKHAALSTDECERGPLGRELQTALVPVNRGAARRALSRLYREIRRNTARISNRRLVPPMAPSDAPPVGRRHDGTSQSNPSPAVATAEQLSDHPPSVAPVRIGEQSPARQPRVEYRRVKLPPLPRSIAVDAPVSGNRSQQCRDPREEIPDLELPQSGGTCRWGHRAASSAGRRIGHSGNEGADPGRPPTWGVSGCVAGNHAGAGSACQEVGASGLADSSGTSNSVRETTLVMAPVAPRAMSADPESAGRLRSATGTANPSGPDLPSPTGAEPPRELTEPLAVGRHSLRDGTAREVEDTNAAHLGVWEPTQALPLVTRRRETDSIVAIATHQDSSNWDATAIDSVVEVTDEEIEYDEAVGDAPWLDVDCSDLVEFEVVAPRTRLIEGVDPGSSGLSSSDGLGSTNAADAMSFDESDESDGSDDIDESERLPPSTVVEWPRETLYRRTQSGSESSRTSAAQLVAQLRPRPLWTEGELCRNLRAAAGLELTPGIPATQTATPPPIITTRSLPSQEQLEPTRRLRRVSATLAVLLFAGALPFSGRIFDASAAAASQLPTDALGQLCRASLTVKGVQARQILRLRQSGDAQFRDPTSQSGDHAEFLGMRCGEGAELLIGDNQREAVRRWPISGNLLQPRGLHPLAHLELELDGATKGASE